LKDEIRTLKFQFAVKKRTESQQSQPSEEYTILSQKENLPNDDDKE